MYIRQEELIEQFKTLGKSISVTYGKFEIPATCTETDLNWNQMDQDHRPWIHKTYLSSLRLATTPDAQFSITRLGRFFHIPFFVSVSDIRVERGVYYQGFTVFNMIYVHVVTRCQPGVHSGEWYIVSHPFFKPFHWFLNRKLQELNRSQNLEDVPVRNRRAELRAKGYGFTREDPDFLTANLKTPNVIYPTLPSPVKIPLSGLKLGDRNPIEVGNIRLLILPESGAFSVWNEVCPHEGGPLLEGKICPGGREIECPWHGLKFPAVRLTSDQPRANLGQLSLLLDSQSGWIEVS